MLINDSSSGAGCNSRPVVTVHERKLNWCNSSTDSKVWHKEDGAIRISLPSVYILPGCKQFFIYINTQKPYDESD